MNYLKDYGTTDMLSTYQGGNYSNEEKKYDITNANNTGNYEEYYYGNKVLNNGDVEEETKYTPDESKFSASMQFYEGQYNDYGSYYYQNDNANQNDDAYKNEYVDQTLVKYEYIEPDENFISIDDLKYKPSLLNMILPPKKDLEDDHSSTIDIKPDIEIKEDESWDSEPMEMPVKAELEEIEENNDRISDEEIEDDDVIIIEDGDEEIDENEEGEEFDWMDLEQGKQLYECFLCNKKVVSSYNLRRHMMIHTGDRPFGCDICLKRFREFSDLKKHRRVHSNEKSFKCMVCQKNTPSEWNATKCISCDTDTKRDYAPYGKLFLGDVPTIEGSDKKAFVCPECDRIFGSRHNLKRHFMIHTGEKPYHCDVCDKAFREVSTLKKHMLTHSRIKLFKCFICEREFNDFGSYNRHKNTHGKNSKQKINLQSNQGENDEDSYLFECNECHKRFSDVTMYKDHLKLHSFDFLFQCYICKRMFRTKEKLNSHFVTHSYDDDDD